jgi:hypothetical protein
VPSKSDKRATIVEPTVASRALRAEVEGAWRELEDGVTHGLSQRERHDVLALLTRMAGPFTFVPALTCVVTMSCMAYPAFIKRSWVLVVIMVASFTIPLVLEARGLLTTTWELRDGALYSHAGALVISGTRTFTLVVGATLATFVIAGIHAASIARTGRRAQLALVTQAWHLRQLLPAVPS